LDVRKIGRQRAGDLRGQRGGGEGVSSTGGYKKMTRYAHKKIKTMSEIKNNGEADQSGEAAVKKVKRDRANCP